MPSGPALTFSPGAYTPANWTPNWTGNISTRKGIQRGLGTTSSILGGQAATEAAQRAQAYGKLMPGYSSLLSSGYSPTEKSAISQSTLGGISGAYGGALEEARRRQARTGNVTGGYSFLSKMAREKGGALAQQNLQNQAAFADETLRRK